MAVGDWSPFRYGTPYAGHDAGPLHGRRSGRVRARRPAAGNTTASWLSMVPCLGSGVLWGPVAGVGGKDPVDDLLGEGPVYDT